MRYGSQRLAIKYDQKHLAEKKTFYLQHKKITTAIRKNSLIIEKIFITLKKGRDKFPYYGQGDLKIFIKIIMIFHNFDTSVR